MEHSSYVFIYILYIFISPEGSKYNAHNLQN